LGLLVDDPEPQGGSVEVDYLPDACFLPTIGLHVIDLSHDGLPLLVVEPSRQGTDPFLVAKK
jgi:hypothetical protein